MDQVLVGLQGTELFVLVVGSLRYAILCQQIFIESIPNSRNFLEGEKIINAGQLIFSVLNNQSAN